MTIQLPSPGNDSSSTVTSPLLTSTEDLIRFPSESLHSFSFAQKSNDFVQMRQNVLKRSIDLLKDKGMWAAGGLGIASAQAKLDGDQEVQSMIELLDKAHLLGNDALRPNGSMATGPLTGPAYTSADNVFEKSFNVERSASPESMAIRRDDEDIRDNMPNPTETPSLTINVPDEPPRRLDDQPLSAPFSVSRPRGLKRTYTDVSSLTLQSKLTEAMSRPYLADESALLSPAAFTPQDMSVTPFAGLTPHAHGRHTPASQAIFTTQSEDPWTITASNDLACLAFGVQASKIRKLSTLDMIREDKRQWLRTKLERAKTPSMPKLQAMTSPTRSPIMGTGLTARLLSKAPSRETGRRNKSADALGSSTTGGRYSPKPLAELPKSNGVLLCGDVIPIQKRNGDVGSATLWLQEKRDKLIWVMEEIAEDVAFLSVDEIGCVTKVSGKSEAVWGMEHVRPGMDVIRMIPDMPRLKGTNTGALDYHRIADLRSFTARTSNDISIPITVDQISGQPTFRVSSFPHIAGMMVVSSSSLKISSSNTVVSEALFGRSTNGLFMNDLIPGFDSMLNMLVQDDDIDLVEGMVIPEHSFRRARAVLALREGKKEAAAVFLRPNGLPAIHRDGAQILVDLQMRVVKSETFGQAFAEQVIEEEEEEENGVTMKHSNARSGGTSKVDYAIWFSYDKALHAEHHGIGPISPLISRPSTPPHQPSPSNILTLQDESESDDGARVSSAHTSATELTPPLSSAQPMLRRDSSANLDTQLSPQSPETSGEFRKTMSITDYTILEEMGAGAYGQVKLARPRITAPPSIRAFSKVVIKYVTKRRILVDTWTRDRKLGTVPLEIHTLDYLKRDGLRHENIIEMIDFFEDETNYYILMKPHGLPGMDLFDYIELRVNMGEDECRKIFAQVVAGVHFLHTKAKVVHRDIKDENVILDGEGRIKLIDFGSASYIRNGPFDVFVGTIGTYPLSSPFLFAIISSLASPSSANPSARHSSNTNKTRLRSARSPLRHDLRRPQTRRLGPRYPALHHPLQGEPLLQH